MKKGRRRKWWVILVLALIVAAILAGYYFGIDREREEGVSEVSKKKIPSNMKETPAPGEMPRVEETIPPEKEVVQQPETQDKETPVLEDPCKAMDDQLHEFFNYLDSRSYMQDMEKGIDTYEWFKVLLNKLSFNPPVPSGEALDKEIMIRNVFFFFRTFGRKDIRLIKEIMRNEADTLEMNLDFFYRWLMLGDKCPDREEMRPSPDLTYTYAGYLLNTLGGRANLTRRPTGLRLLITYYCVLRIHEADKNGKNRYGIDVLPEIDPLIQEIGLYPDFLFQGNYIDRLNQIKSYYLKKR